MAAGRTPQPHLGAPPRRRVVNDECCAPTRRAIGLSGSAWDLGGPSGQPIGLFARPSDYKDVVHVDQPSATPGEFEGLCVLPGPFGATLGYVVTSHKNPYEFDLKTWT